MHINTTAIVLSHRDHKERDRFYTLLTRELGKIVVRGSGARKSGAKLSPHLEPLMVTHVAIAKNRGRGTVTFALNEESMPHVRAEVWMLDSVRAFVATVDRLMREDDPHPAVFDVVRVYLHTLDRLVEHGAPSETCAVVTQGAYSHLLARLGWHVETAACIRCHGALTKGETYTYVLGDGGFLCADCAHGSRVSQHQTVTLSRDAAAALHVFGTNSIPSFAKLSVSRAVCDELARLTQRRIAWVS